MTRLALAWFGIVNLQFLLGAATIWSLKAADVATAHVVTGALALLTGAGLVALALRGRAVEATFQSSARSDLNRDFSHQLPVEVAR